MDTLIHWSEVSDSHRWLANEYKYDWVKTLSDSDKKIAKALLSVADMEMFSLTFTASTKDRIKLSVPKEYQSDFVEILLFTSIMTYEEFRHGMVLYTVNNRTIGHEDLFLDDDSDWDVYQMLMTVCASESIQAPLYSAAAKRIENGEFKTVITNIRNDEIRHYNALRLLIKDLINKSEYHKKRALAVLPKIVSGHIGDMKNHFKYAVKDTLDILSSKDLLEMVNMKHKLFESWFGIDNPYSRTDILKSHINDYKIY